MQHAQIRQCIVHATAVGELFPIRLFELLEQLVAIDFGRFDVLTQAQTLLQHVRLDFGIIPKLVNALLIFKALLRVRPEIELACEYRRKEAHLRRVHVQVRTQVDHEMIVYVKVQVALFVVWKVHVGFVRGEHVDEVQASGQFGFVGFAEREQAFERDLVD